MIWYVLVSFLFAMNYIVVAPERVRLSVLKGNLNLNAPLENGIHYSHYFSYIARE